MSQVDALHHGRRSRPCAGRGLASWAQVEALRRPTSLASWAQVEASHRQSLGTGTATPALSGTSSFTSSRYFLHRRHCVRQAQFGSSQEHVHAAPARTGPRSGGHASRGTRRARRPHTPGGTRGSTRTPLALLCQPCAFRHLIGPPPIPTQDRPTTAQHQHTLMSRYSLVDGLGQAWTQVGKHSS